jgi:cephalosporin-C deacetylase
MTHRCRALAALLVLALAGVPLAGARADDPLVIVPHNPTGIYHPGATVGWTVWSRGSTETRGGHAYEITRDWGVVLQSGRIDLGSGPAVLETRLSEPAMIHLDITTGDGGTPVRAAAAMAPWALEPSVPEPPDFDAFWERQIARLRSVPGDSALTPEPGGREDVDYATVRLGNVGGAHVYGQLAHPARPGAFPAMLVLQWAGGPYPLQKEWVTGPAADGWLALNVMPHDVPGHMPPEFYAALPQVVKGYTRLYDDDRERNYFLQMYLGAYQAVEFLANHPRWDRRILLATGTSMGGQQSLAVAGLHRKVTHVIVHVPAGADANGPARGRAAGYPFWDATRPQVLETAKYFDTVNLAARITATSLVSLGFIDDVCPPVGVWVAFNRIRGPKEIVPLTGARHNHQATAEQQQLYYDRQRAWLGALVRGEEPEVRPPPTDGTPGESDGRAGSRLRRAP